MTPEQFAYWFQGFAELTLTPPTPEQWQAIREHLATVFQKVTPPVMPAGPVKREPLIDYLEEARKRAEQPVQPSPFRITPTPFYPLQPYQNPLGPGKFPDIIC